MSYTDSPGQQPAENVNVPEVPSSARKSYRRKYRKIMVNFEDRMKESTVLFKEEQRIFDISQRLAEQTDQILQIILDLNSHPQVPPRLRYDLRPPNFTEVKHQESKRSYDGDEGHVFLRRMRLELRTGTKSLTDYRELRNQVLDGPEFEPQISYSELAASVPIANTRQDEHSESSAHQITGFLTTKQEEQCIQKIDSLLATQSTTFKNHLKDNPGSRSAENAAEREREIQLKNPVSVYNWLRKNQPQVFLQDHEANNDKPPKPAGSRSSRRTTINKDTTKKQQDFYDEDGIALEPTSGSRGKRKRDDDGGYRPRGGNSRPSKRKKEETNQAGKRGKRSSIDMQL